MKQRLYLIDIEGVLVRDKRYQPVDGAVAWLNGLADRGIDWRLVSNNTTHRPVDLVADLAAVGFRVDETRLVGALECSLAIMRHEGWRQLGWLGCRNLVDWVVDAGFEVVDDGNAACHAVVLGVGPDMQLADLDRGLSWLRRGAALVCLHRNRFWLDAEGRARLGPGAMAAALEAAVPSVRSLTVGKPEPTIYLDALNSLGGTPSEALFISDDPFTDLVGARRLGIATVFVLSGKYPSRGTLNQLAADQQPDLVLDRADQL